MSAVVFAEGQAGAIVFSGDAVRVDDATAAQVELDRIQTSADKAAAEVARDEAEAARDAAQLSSGIYADTTAGLAATVSGGYFSTPSGDSDEYLILYLNSAGTAVEVETYPSAAVVQDLQDRVPPEFLARPLAPESGFVWAVTDDGGRPGVAMDLEGGLLARLRADANVPVSAMDNVETVTPESGYLWSIVDENDRLSIGVKDDGSVYIAKLHAVIVGAVTLPTSTVTCYGDSMTAGAGGGGTTIATAIAAALPDRATNNRGTGGQNSAAIATRQGGLPMQCTVTSDQIPASGPVTLTARSQTPITNQGSASYTGTLAGVAGTLSASTGDGGATYTYTFTRTDAGSITACPAATPFIFDYDIADRADVLVVLVWAQ
ncbi:MAG: hypothetical protein IPL86_19305 [Flavobacteriales bacterium]|nr:hypothetical protein [Flavobacteriales bacterium]